MRRILGCLDWTATSRESGLTELLTGEDYRLWKARWKGADWKSAILQAGSLRYESLRYESLRYESLRYESLRYEKRLEMLAPESVGEAAGGNDLEITGED
jgi:hypothetical protein